MVDNTKLNMKLQNIKTKSEFYQFADIWYQRAHNLRDVWQNTGETNKRKIHAFNLWYIMYKRVMELTQISIKMNQVKHPKDFKNGGVWIAEINRD